MGTSTNILDIAGTFTGLPFIGSVFDEVFGNTDRGHYEGTTFVPGDLQSRMSYVNNAIKSRGLLTIDVDDATIKSLVYVEAGWQNSINNYLDKVLQNKRNTNTSTATTASTPTLIDTTIPNQTSVAGFTLSNTLIYVLLFGLAVFIIMKYN